MSDEDKTATPAETGEKVGMPKNLSFSQALEVLKRGGTVARAGWNGKNMWLLLVPGTKGVRPVAGTAYSNAGIVEATNINPHIDMFTAQGDMQPGWLASQTDLLADDWCVLTDPPRDEDE